MDSMRAQVAAEFLATYGWAFFAVFMLLAVLVGSGLINPGRFAGEDCTAQPELACSSYYLKKTGPNAMETGLKLTNQMGFPVYVKDVRIVYDGTVYPCNDASCGSETMMNASDADVMRVQMGNVRQVPAQMTQIFLTFNYRSCADFNASAQCAIASPALYPLHRTTVRLNLNPRNA